MANARIKETMERQGYSAADIAEALAKGFVSAPPAPPKLEPEEEEVTQSSSPNNFSWAGVSTEQQNLTAEEIGLTEEDVAYLRLK